MFTVYLLHSLIGFGITVGAHRYYTHRSFKANLALRCFLATMFTAAGEVSTTGKTHGYIKQIILINSICNNRNK
jgi:fatty-acid desaturase